MKKTLILAALFFVALAANAQVQVALGLKAGPNFASIDTKASAGQNYKNRTGFHAGAFALVKLTKFGIQPEIIFSQQGSKVTINSKDFESNFTYINIPVMFKLYTIAGLNLQVGPQFGFVSKAETPITDQSAPSGFSVQDVKDKAKSSDISLGLGLGWDLPFGLTIDGRYNLGLSKMFDQIPPGLQTADAKNQVFQISLGYKFIKLGK